MCWADPTSTSAKVLKNMASYILNTLAVPKKKQKAHPLIFSWTVFSFE